MATHVIHESDPLPLPAPESAQDVGQVIGRLITVLLMGVAAWAAFGGLSDTNVLGRAIFLPLLGAFSMAVLTQKDRLFHQITALFYCVLVAILTTSLWVGSFGLTKYADPYSAASETPNAVWQQAQQNNVTPEQGALAASVPNTQWMYEQDAQWWRIVNPPDAAPGEGRVILDARWHVGLDGWSFALVVLTGLIFVIACMASFGIQERTKEYFAWFLVLLTAILGTFAALNFILFYIFWEMMLVPMYFLIAIWGGPRREYAAIKMFLYTLLGSVFLLLGVLYLYFNAGLNTFEFGDVQRAVLAKHATIPVAHMRLVWLGIFLGFAIKVPIFPFHTWLPDAHVEAPTPASVILAAILLKMGTYGFFRVLLPIFPEETKYFTWLLALLGTIGIVYGALVAMAQEDLKKLVAYSSVGHMGFCILGFATQNELGISGAYFMVLGHGIISAAMFLLVGVIYDRAHTRMIDAFGGLMYHMRYYALVAYIASFANLGLPGLVGFWGELFVLIGSFNASYPWGAFNLMRVMACFAVLGMLTTAAYMLWMVQRVFLGKPNPRWAGLPDLSVREHLTLWPLVIGMIAFGVMPGWLMDTYNPSLTILTNWLQNWQSFATYMPAT